MTIEKTYRIITLSALLVIGLFARNDRSPHRAQFITVDNGVRLEVLDWGGSGRPLEDVREVPCGSYTCLGLASHRATYFFRYDCTHYSMWSKL